MKLSKYSILTSGLAGVLWFSNSIYSWGYKAGRFDGVMAGRKEVIERYSEDLNELERKTEETLRRIDPDYPVKPVVEPTDESDEREYLDRGVRMPFF